MNEVYDNPDYDELLNRFGEGADYFTDIYNELFKETNMNSKTPNPTSASPINHVLVAERTETILRALSSGVNDCNTLMCGGKLNEDFVRSSIRPTIQVCIEEADQFRQDNAALRRDLELKRQALELVVGNNCNLTAAKDALAKALPGHPHLQHLDN